MVMCSKSGKVIKVPFIVREGQGRVFLLKKQLGSSCQSNNRIEALQIVSLTKGLVTFAHKSTWNEFLQIVIW